MVTITVTHYPFASHFCNESVCKFGKTTTVGEYVISSVGEYYPTHLNGKMDTLGWDRTYETYVFKGWRLCKCEDCKTKGEARIICENYGEIDSLPANSQDEANANHQTLVEKYTHLATVEALGQEAP